MAFDDLIRQIEEKWTAAPRDAMLAAGIAVLLLAAIVVLWLIMRRRKAAPRPAAPQLTIDLAELGEADPPGGQPELEFYNIPVRVAAVVLAPVGLVRQLPPAEGLAELFDALVPGLDGVVARHKPLLRNWPAQVSARGFAHTFLSGVHLPGEGGKGTPWSSAAGMFKLHGQPVMAGLVLRAARPNSFGQVILDSEEKWLGCFRVRHRVE
jgi:hypothetical protein